MWFGHRAVPFVRNYVLAALVLFALALVQQPAHAQCPPDVQQRLFALEFSGGDEFGHAVDIDGDTAVIGAWADNLPAAADAGSAYVFVRSGGSWSQQAKLTASDFAVGDNFGSSVAVHGDTVIVGATNDDHAGGANAGSAYVFVRQNDVWSQQAKLIASDAAAGDEFGYSVAIDGETTVIGARRDDHAGGADAGAAYVFIRCLGLSWSQQSKLTAADAFTDDAFGGAVAISGNTVVVGAYKHDTIDDFDGAAYVFGRAGTFWSQHQKLTAFDAAIFDQFGYSVTISGDTLIVGTLSDDHAGGIDAGSAYVFVRAAGVWAFQVKLTATDATLGDQFGYSVDLSGNTALIGAPMTDEPGSINAGSVYVFNRTGALWTQEAKVIADDAAPDDALGTSVAISGVSCIAGAPLDDHFFGVDAGSAYAFDLTCDADGDGVPDNVDVCPDNDPTLETCANGRPQRDCNNDCLVNGLDVACITAEMLLE